MKPNTSRPGSFPRIDVRAIFEDGGLFDCDVSMAGMYANEPVAFSMNGFHMRPVGDQRSLRGDMPVRRSPNSCCDRVPLYCPFFVSSKYVAEDESFLVEEENWALTLEDFEGSGILDFLLEDDEKDQDATLAMKRQPGPLPLRLKSQIKGTIDEAGSRAPRTEFRSRKSKKEAAIEDLPPSSSKRGRSTPTNVFRARQLEGTASHNPARRRVPFPDGSVSAHEEGGKCPVAEFGRTPVPPAEKAGARSLCPQQIPCY